MAEQEHHENVGRHLAARQLQERYGWQLIAPDALVEGAMALLARGDAGSLSQALVGAYCLVLHDAFLGGRGAEQQRRACEELARALAGMLRRSYPDMPADEREDVTQNALERVWRARDSCQQPVAFLAFAAFHLRSATQQSRRQLQRLGEPLRPLPDDDSERAEPPDSSPSPLDQVLHKERRSDIARFLGELRAARPRARLQIEILELRWLEELDYAEICGRLQISLANAQTRLSRILHTIRTDPELLRRARELGLS